jgi:hypothetical protein
MINLTLPLSEREVNEENQRGELPNFLARCLLLAESMQTSGVQCYFRPTGYHHLVKLQKQEVRTVLMRGDHVRAIETPSPMALVLDFDAVGLGDQLEWGHFKITSARQILDPAYSELVSRKRRALLEAWING